VSIVHRLVVAEAAVILVKIYPSLTYCYNHCSLTCGFIVLVTHMFMLFHHNGINNTQHVLLHYSQLIDLIVVEVVVALPWSNGMIIFKHSYIHRKLERLGSGEFGIVSRGLLNDNLQIAVKSINTDATEKDKLRFLQEAAIMCQFDHENVIKLYGVVTEDPVMIVLEYMSRGDLRSLLIDLQPS